MVLATVKGDVHDIGKNLVDIILTNNGYEVINLGIKQTTSRSLNGRGAQGRRHRHERPAGQVDAHHERQSGGAEPTPRQVREPRHARWCCATRTYVEGTDVIYDGRVLDGNDAFEGLHCWTASWRKRSGVEDPKSAPRCSGRNYLRAAASKSPRSIRRPCRIDRWSGTSTSLQLLPVPRHEGRQLSRSTTSPSTGTRPPCSATSGAYGPNGEQTRISRTGTARRCAATGRGEGGRPPRSVGGLRPLRRQRRGQRPRRLRTHAILGVIRFTFPRQRKSRNCASQTSSARPTGDADFAAFHDVTVGAGASEEQRTCSPRTAIGTTCSSRTSVEMTEARPSSGIAGSARNGASPTRTRLADRPVPRGLPGWPASVRLPCLPSSRTTPRSSSFSKATASGSASAATWTVRGRRVHRAAQGTRRASNRYLLKLGPATSGTTHTTTV